MALTKPHFSKQFQLEPLSHYHLTRAREKIEKYSQDQNRFRKRSQEKRLLPSLLPEKFWKNRVERKYTNNQSSSEYSPKATKVTSVDYKMNEGFQSNKNFLRNRLNLPEAYNSSQSPFAKDIYRKFNHCNPCPRNHLKKQVTFKLPSKSEETQLGCDETKPNVTAESQLKHDSLPIIPFTKTYHMTKHISDDVSMLCEKLESMADEEQKRQRAINDLNSFRGQQAFKRTTGDLNNVSIYKKSSLTQKVQSRRVKGYLVKHTLPKLTTNSNGVLLSPAEKATNLPPSSVLQRARKILLEKVQTHSLHPNKNNSTRRVIFLPSLAAPCSEEFAITMRRVYGKKFISSPNVLDHVVKRAVPLRATASLLDAIMRPPSTPSCDRHQRHHATTINAILPSMNLKV